MKRKPNIIDILIILIFILVLLTAVFRLINIGNLPFISKSEPVIYTVNIYNQDIEYNNIINKDDKLYLYTSNQYCGEITDVKYQYLKETIYYNDGTVKTHINPSKINITLTVAFDAHIHENGFYTKDNTFLFPGYSSLMYTNAFLFDGQITNVSAPND